MVYASTSSIYGDRTDPSPEDVSVHDTMADAAKMREATGREPEIPFEEGRRRVRIRYE